MSKFQRREYQKLMTSFMLQHPRCNIWASMGSGKSGATLWVLNRLFRNGQLNDDDRVLILAPLRVASGTWPANGSLEFAMSECHRCNRFGEAPHSGAGVRR
uniref:DNA helicase n=1 Tax=Salmonella phage vB_SE130_2P TaxID=3236707 RepID=A0AB39C592_9VIRU